MRFFYFASVFEQKDCLVGNNEIKKMFGMTAVKRENLHSESLNIVLERFYKNLPKKPYQSNGLDYEGLKINNKNEAIKKTYIQFNHPQWKKYIVIDIDHPGALVDWIYENSHLPAPNLVIENPKNGHAHCVYELVDAVSFTERSSVKAQKYYKEIERLLTQELKGDARYNGLISKNPYSSNWRTTSFREEAYHLKELANKLDLEFENQTFKPQLEAQNDADVINGRNDEVFHSVRHLAYKDIRDFKNNSERLFTHWFNHVLDLVKEKNSLFPSPLGYRECTHIAKSISNYCWKKHEECYSKFVERQKAKGAKGGKNKSAKYEDKRNTAKRLFRMGENLKDIALKLAVSYRSVLRYTKGLARLKLLDFGEINNLRKSALAEKSTKQSEVHKSYERSECINNKGFGTCDNSQNQVLARRHAFLCLSTNLLKRASSLSIKKLNIVCIEEMSEVSFSYFKSS